MNYKVHIMKKLLSVFCILSSVILFTRVAVSAQEADTKQDPQNQDIQQDKKNINPVGFREVWGYLMRGEENVFKGDEPVTDICYFSCELNSSGRINTNVNPPFLKEINGRKRRIHMVIANLNNTRMMHYILNPRKSTRDLLVNDIIEISRNFDGVQIDFEAVGVDDADNFLDFLGLIKAGLEPDKTLSVALLPKAVKVKDAYDYKAISDVVDRVFIMAYDQHWSTSRPGPVASLSWCSNIMEYAKNEIPAEKLIMGIPLYGRSWQNVKVVKRIHPKKKPAAKIAAESKCRTITRYVTRSSSVKACNINKFISDENFVKEYSQETGFKIKYKGDSGKILYCDDVNATKEKFYIYSRFVDSIGFWRLGMENPEMWDEIVIKYN